MMVLSTGYFAKEIAKIGGSAILHGLVKKTPPGAKAASEPISVRRRVRLGSEATSIEEDDVRQLVKKLLLRAGDKDPEIRAMSDGEAVQTALVETLLGFGSITYDRIYAVHLDSERLTRELCRGSDDRRSKLSEHGRELFDVILTSCAENVVDFVTQSDYFRDRAAVEQAKAIGRLLGDPSEFQASYVERVCDDLNSMSLFGLKLSPELQTYNLETAYVSPSLQWTHPADSGNATPRHTDPVTAAEEVGRLYLEDLLSDHQYLILEGPAGSGKTTLLKRLALHSVNFEFTSRASSWNGLVPFFLQVRRFAGEGLPLPERYVEHIAPMLSGEKPDRWVSETLRSGNSVLLIDGVDEISSDLRTEVLKGISEIAKTYPQVAIVVSTRPGAITGRGKVDLEELGFSSAVIEPMNHDQIAECVRSWHAAYDLDGRVTSSLNEDSDPGAELIASIYSRRDLLRLASTPLLCAMLCALNLNSNSWLPRDRNRLYRDALEMLLERRDREQQIVVEDLDLEFQHLEPLLARLAGWMLLEGTRSISEEQAEARIAEFLPRIRRTSSSESPLEAAAVLRHLTARSGVLERISADHIEFRHPSFQDYLAASDLLRNDQFNHLINNAHDPLYHDVIIMAVAQGQNDFGRQRELLPALTGRAERDSANSRVLWLLAAAAVADLGIVDPAIEEDIEKRTKGLLPPQDTDQANALAQVGSFVLDLLGEILDQRELTQREAAATVRAACLMVTEESIALLKRLAKYSVANSQVQASFLLGWGRAPNRIRYEQEVLSKVDLRLSSVHVRQKAELSIFDSVSKVGGLKTGAWCTSDDLRSVRGLESISELNLEGSQVESIDFLANWPSLEVLNLSETRVANISDVSRLNGLTSLGIANCLVDDLEPIRHLVNLEALDITDSKVTSIEPLSKLSKLRWLKMASTKVSDLSPIGNLVSLETLVIGWTDVSDISSLAGLSSLQSLELTGTGVRSLDSLSQLVSLEHLDAHMSDVEVLEPLQALVKLRDLDVSSTLVHNIAPLTGLSSLNKLNLHSTKVRDVSPLSKIAGLEALNLCGTEISDLTCLLSLDSLKILCIEPQHLDLPGLDKISRDVEIAGLARWVE